MAVEHGTVHQPRVAYFSMEIALEAAIPTYSGGLGVLAGDTLRSAADLGMSMVAVSLVHRAGYLAQRLDAAGHQSEASASWSPEGVLTEMRERATIELDGRPLHLRAWRYDIRGASGDEVGVYLLDTALPENAPGHRGLTDTLYGGDDRLRLQQEAVLGLGGVAMLRALGFTDIEVFHSNEGHAALLALGLLREFADGPLTEVSREAIESVRDRFVFTTHTPVQDGHDTFAMSLVRDTLGEEIAAAIEQFECCPPGRLEMTGLALFCARFTNGVSRRHGEVSRLLFPAYPVVSITNGVHAATWATPAFQALFDRSIPDWRQRNASLRYVAGIPLDEIRKAHETSKAELLEAVQRRTGRELSRDVMTIGFGRRATGYKRLDLLFSDLDRLRAIVARVGPLQVVFAGKAHRSDEIGQHLIRNVFEAASQLGRDLETVYVEDYDMAFGRLLCGGSDIWLNTPIPPLEASGTSGMKAALNGVPSLSILDGWWVEGHIEGVTGWSIGDASAEPAGSDADADALYSKLEHVVLPMFYRDPSAFDAIRRSAIALNGSFFNTERMLLEYEARAYSQPLAE